ncbi:hypothetical protein DENSPDRAFT_760313, partial [Dentipellis sp. KUC8613]
FSKGQPVVVTKVDLPGPWSPSSFIRLYGSDTVKLVDTETDDEFESTLSDFFSGFGASEPRARSLKLKDWPPTEHLKTRYGQHYDSFKLAVPFPDLTRPDGVLNLAAHFPDNMISPDLGPKLYSAYGTVDDGSHHGSTRLHKDVTDAVNVMTHASVSSCGALNGARWVIFDRNDAQALSNLLRVSPRFGYKGPGDPIHSQNIYLTPEDLQFLRDVHHITPYVFTQQPGDAVFIPAGSPHQVCNFSDSIKVAYDFICMENLPTTLDLAREYRQERLVNEGDDVLQIYKTLWDAWLC